MRQAVARCCRHSSQLDSNLAVELGTSQRDVAQLVARPVWDRKAVGSSPAIPTDSFSSREGQPARDENESLDPPWCNGSTRVFGARWSGFESLGRSVQVNDLDTPAFVAQRIAQRFPESQVAGSNPAEGTQMTVTTRRGDESDEIGAPSHAR